MPNAKDAELQAHHSILLVGRTGSGKTSQLWTLPGRKFVYIFDPNSLRTLRGLDLDYELFLPDVTELDATIKGFNKDSSSDRLASKREPTVYLRWVDHLNELVEGGGVGSYDWLCFDSLTFLSRSLMDRQLFLNKRYGDVEELADYRVVGSKLADVFTSIASLPLNIYATGHISTFEDEKTRRMEVQLNLPGKARAILPRVFTDIWEAFVGEDGKYMVRTRPDARGLQDIRASFPLQPAEDVTIPHFDASAVRYGIGRLLPKS